MQFVKPAKRKPFRMQNETELLDSLNQGCDPISLLRLATEFKHNRKVVLAAINRNATALKYAGPEFKNDKDIVMLAVDINPQALQYASNELRNDKDVVLKAVSKLGWVFKFARGTIKKDIDVATTALNATLMSASAFQHLPVKFKKNKSLAIMAINKDPYYEEPLNGWIYSSLADELKNDNEVILAENLRFENIKDKPPHFI
jgi:hypothetical protein